MRSPNPEFDRAFAAKLAGRDSLAFSEYLELALYHPECGYYAKAGREVGRTGDFYTNVSIGPIFAEILLEPIVEMWGQLGSPAPFHVIEQGAHHGQFAADFLIAASRKPAFSSAMRYVIVEPLSGLAQRQRSALAAFSDRVEWHTALTDLHGLTGVHWSNELIDAFPFELIEWNGARWCERRVVRRESDYFFQTERIANDELLGAVEALPVPSAAGYQTEIRLNHRPWLDALNPALSRGWVLLCDYGYARAEYYSPARRNGTLMGYRQHQRSPDPFESPGEQDLTAHVDFTALTLDAEARGFQLAGFTDQHHFLVGAAETLMRQREGQADSQWLRRLRTLLHPELMGTRFHFLALAKGVDCSLPLAGFRYQTAPRSRLGLSPSLTTLPPNSFPR